MKIVGIMQVGGHTTFLKYSLPNLRQLCDEIVLIGRGGIICPKDGQSDGDNSFLGSCKQELLTNTGYHEFFGKEWNAINHGIKLAQQYKPDWLLFLDSDEVLDISREKLESMVTHTEAILTFKRIWLWGDENHYRSDHPEKFQSYSQYSCFILNALNRQMYCPYPFWLGWMLDWGRKPFVGYTLQLDMPIIRHYAALDPDFKAKQKAYMKDLIRANPFENKKKLEKRFEPMFSEPVLVPLSEYK